MKTYAKGERKKKLPVVILSVALGMTMIPATCMAAEFNSGDTIKEQTVEDLELSSGENNTKDSQKSEIQWTGFKWDSYSQAEITLTSAVNGVCYYKWAERGEDGNPQVPQIETGNTVNDEVLISEDEEFGITLADLDTDQAVDLYIQIEDENGKLSDLKRMELDQDSRPAKKTDSEKKHKASKPKAEDSTVEGLDSPLEFYPDTFYDFKVIGAGTDNEDPENGDIKWVPVYWSTSPNPTDNRKNTTWRIGSAKGINKAATYNMYIFFQKYVYQKSEWKKTDEVQSAVYQFRSAALTTVKLTTPGLSGTSNSPAGIVFKWKKAANASGYKIYRRTGNSSKWVNIATESGSNTLVYTDGSVKSGTMYTYTVRAYKGSALSAYNKNGSRIVRLTAPVQYKPSSKASGKLTVRWKKAAGASGYQIQYAASRSMRGSRTVSASALTRTLSGLKKGSTYYVRIRAYKKVSGKTYYGAWSSVKNVKVRK